MNKYLLKIDKVLLEAYELGFKVEDIVNLTGCSNKYICSVFNKLKGTDSERIRALLIDAALRGKNVAVSDDELSVYKKGYENEEFNSLAYVSDEVQEKIKLFCDARFSNEFVVYILDLPTRLVSSQSRKYKRLSVEDSSRGVRYSYDSIIESLKLYGEILKVYSEGYHSFVEMADMFGCSRKTMKDYCDAYCDSTYLGLSNSKEVSSYRRIVAYLAEKEGLSFEDANVILKTIIKMYKKRITKPQIAEECGISVEAVKTIIAYLTNNQIIEPNYRRGQGVIVDEETFENIISLYWKGYYYTEIGKKFGLSESTVAIYVNKHLETLSQYDKEEIERLRNIAVKELHKKV